MSNNKENISQIAIESLNNRLANSENYNLDEINKVSNLKINLFEDALDKEGTEIFRDLCSSYSLTKTLIIKKSHRPIIGPVIYFMKKVVVKILQPIIKPQFDQIESFNRNTVSAIAKLYNNNSER